jgi:hypothetical protein
MVTVKVWPDYQKMFCLSKTFLDHILVGVHVAQSFLFCVVLCVSLFVHFPSFFCIDCLFDLRLLIGPLISSNFIFLFSYLETVAVDGLKEFIL